MNPTFRTVVQAAGGGISIAAITDLNGDGILDLVVTGNDEVGVLLGNGAGFGAGPSFHIPASLANVGSGIGRTSVAVADVNGDGRPDLVVVGPGEYPSFADAGLYVALNDGHGGFSTPVRQAALPGGNGVYPSGVVLADVNGDAIPDAIVVGGSSGSQAALSVFLGDGRGGFGAPATVGAGPYFPTYYTAADLNGDGHVDLVGFDFGEGVGADVLLGDGHGGFSAPVRHATGLNSYAYGGTAILADVNGDGILDIVATGDPAHATSDRGYDPTTVSVQLGDGHAGFGAPSDYAAGDAVTGVAVADVNGDGIADIVVLQGNGTGIGILLGDGHAGFGAPISEATGTTIPRGTLALGDFDGDGQPDILAGPQDGQGPTTVLLNTTLASPAAVPVVTAAGGHATLSARATGNETIVSQGTDVVNAGGGRTLVFASGPAATVNGGTGALTFVAGPGAYTAGGGSGTDILYAGSGTSVLTGSSGANSILVAGAGNVTLQGGAGSGALMFGGLGASQFTGSTGGGDTLVGGAGPNAFAMSDGDIAFGGPGDGDVFNAGAGTSLIVEGPGATQILHGTGSMVAFAGTGADNYVFSKGTGGTAEIIGFKPTDHITLTDGFTHPQTAFTGATTGSYGTTIHLNDGASIVLFGATLSASQITSA